MHFFYVGHNKGVMTKKGNVYKYKSKDPSLSKVSDVAGLNHTPHLINPLITLEVYLPPKPLVLSWWP